MKKRKLLYTFILCSLISCGHENMHYHVDNRLVEDGQISEDTIAFQGVKEMYSVPSDICCIDNYTIITQQNRDSVFRIIDSKTDSVVACFGKIGHSRNEFLNIPQRVYCVREYGGRPLLCVQEKLHTKIIDIRQSVESNNCVITEIIKDPVDYIFHSTYHLGNKTSFNYITVSYEDARDQVYIQPKFYMNDDPKNGWDIFPQIIAPTFSNLIDCAYAMKVMVSPDGKHAVGIQHFIDIVTIFDFQGKNSIGIINPEGYNLEDIETEFNKNNIKERLIWYNTSGCVTDKGFMVLKGGDYYRNVAYIDSEDGSSVIISYDWNGIKQSSYIINRKLKHIAYNEKAHILYAISYADKLYSFKLAE